MADSVCGPSNAGKSLVNHFDRNRSIQQDRFVNSSPAHNAASFRSSPLSARNDAAFDTFQSQTSSSSLPAAMQMQLPGMPLNMQPAGQSSHPAGIAAAPSWVRDFQTMRLGTGSPHTVLDPQNGGAAMNGSLSNAPHGVQAPIQPSFGAQSMFANPYMASEAVPSIHNPAMFLPTQQHYQSAIPLQAAQQDPATRVEYTHYPQNITLSHSTEAALDAAFAAYDEDFEDEMGQWIASRDVTSGDAVDMTEVEANMVAIADEQDVDNMRQERVEPQESARPPIPIDDGATTEFRKAAMDILDTVGKNQGEKFKNSSFLELMRRICDKEVVLQGDDLVDVTTGTVLGNNPEDTSPLGAEINGAGSDVAHH